VFIDDAERNQPNLGAACFYGINQTQVRPTSMESTRPRCCLLLFKFHDRRLFLWRDSLLLPTFVLSFSPYLLIWEVPPFRRVTTACSQLLIKSAGCLLHPHFACTFMFEQNKLNLVTCHVSRPSKLKGW